MAISNLQINHFQFALGRARDYLALNEWTMAGQILYQLTNEYPDCSSGVWELLGDVRFHLGLLPLAEYAYRQAIARDLKNTICRYKLGKLYFAENNYRSSVSFFGAAIGLGLFHADVFYERGFSRMRLNQFQLAAEDFDKAIEMGRVEADVFYLSGVCWSKAGQPQKAIRSFDRMIEHHPDRMDAWVARSHLKGFEESLADFDEGVKRYPNNKVVFFLRGEACLIESFLDEAIFNFEKALSLGLPRPGHPDEYSFEDFFKFKQCFKYMCQHKPLHELALRAIRELAGVGQASVPYRFVMRNLKADLEDLRVRHGQGFFSWRLRGRIDHVLGLLDSELRVKVRASAESSRGWFEMSSFN